MRWNLHHTNIEVLSWLRAMVDWFRAWAVLIHFNTFLAALIWDTLAGTNCFPYCWPTQVIYCNAVDPVRVFEVEGNRWIDRDHNIATKNTQSIGSTHRSHGIFFFVWWCFADEGQINLHCLIFTSARSIHITRKFEWFIRGIHRKTYKCKKWKTHISV